jgi:predicted RND superfamily exporter protein
MTKPFYARHYLLIFLLVMFSLPFISRGTRLAIESNNNDIRDWLPPDYPESADVKWFQQHFAGAQFALISWDGCTLGNTEKLKLLSRKLVARDPEAKPTERNKFFASVVTGPDTLAEMTQPPLGLTYHEALRRLEGSLVGPVPEGQGDAARTTCLVVTLSAEGEKTNRNKRLALEEIEAAAQECAIAPAMLHMGGPPVDNVAIDVEGERTLYRLAALSGVVGLGLAYLTFRSIRLTLMIFYVGVLSAGISLAIVYYFGLFECLVQGTETPRFGTVDAILMSMPAVVYVLGLSGAIHIVNYYRDACRHSGLRGAAELAVRHGWVPCLLAALTTALGLLSLFTSDITPIRKFGFFSALGVLGTLLLLFTLLPACLSRFALGEKETTIGQGTREDSLPPWARRISEWVIRRNGFVCAGWATVMVVFALGLTRIDTRVQLLKLFASGADIIGDYAWLETHLGNLVPMELVIGFDPSICRDGTEDAEQGGERYRMTLLERLELVERVQARVESLDDVGRALSVATFVPAIPSSGTHFMKVGQRFATNSRLEQHYGNELLSSEFLAEERAPPGGRDDAEPAEPNRQLWRISARVAALSDVDYGLFVADLRAVVEPVMTVYRDRDRVLAALAAEQKHLRHSQIAIVTTVPADAETTTHAAEIQLLRQLLGEAGAQVRVARLPRDSAGRPLVSKPLADWLKTRAAVVIANHGPDAPPLRLPAIAAAGLTVVDLGSDPPAAMGPADTGIETTYTGIVPLVYKTQRQLLISLRQSIGWAVGLIAVVMMCVLRSPAAGLISMIPNIFPIVIVFGAMGWMNIKIDIGIMMTASVALGVAVDDTVHFLFWFRRGVSDGLAPPAATRLAYQRCARAMMQTTLIGGFGLAVFAVSTFTPTQQFGILMLTLLVAALVGDLLLLPAILAGPAGRIFSGRLRARAAVSEMPSGAVEGPVAGPHERPENRRHDASHRSVNA